MLRPACPRLGAICAMIGLLSFSGCAHHRPEDPDNALVKLLRGAEVQAEDETQRETLRRALEDLRDKPLEALESARYEALDGRPKHRSLVEVLQVHVVPEAPVSYSLEELVEARSSPAGRAAIDELLGVL